MRVDPKSCVYLIGTFDNPKVAHVAYDAIAGLLAAHKSLRLSTPITLYISCSGGYVELGLAIQSVIEQIRREGRKVIAHVLGYAFSSAFDIVQHCDVRRAEPTAGFMTHEEQGADMSGSTSKTELEVIFSRKMELAQIEVYKQRTGKQVGFFKAKIKHRDWAMTAQEALKAGFLDEVVSTVPFTAVPRLSLRRKRSVDVED